MNGAEHVARMGDMRNCTRNFRRGTLRKEPLGRPRWDNIKMDIKGMGYEGLGWIHLA
jgi:hypothetical protein